ncbi:chondroitinase-B domain-containing protein [uncultured Aquimarina sp.]|uniref:chondroitinase-B domain-containing protein n=1 Tax=uncultured Aquimarina sp. TaxID=575652 RepID=UPI0026376E9F|nr:chondroitinase-B domain-containing protein [uncultured Aquimarina sp.]
MKKKYLNLFNLVLWIFFFGSAYAQTVNNNTELQNAIANASAGTTITLSNGTWTNVDIDINKNGTQSNPITIKAQTVGSVFFEGNSHVKMGGSYIVFEGVVFQNPSNLPDDGDDLDPILQFRDSNKDECDHCTITNIKIDSYNGTSSQETLTFKWILVYGQYNEISYSSFIGKHGIGSIINDNRNSTSTEFAEPDFTKIHHNYFADRTPIREVNQDNDQDAIRIGNSSTSLHPSNTEVYDNFFYNWSGEVEIISNKSGENKYYNNTFKNYQGTLTLRHGDNCEVYNNYFFADNRQFSGGVRVIGEGHKIYNNYIEGVNSEKPTGGTTKTAGAINVSNGRPNSALNGYYQVIDATIVNNTFVNCDYGFRIGTNVGNDLTLAPENLVIANNIMINTSENAVDEQTNPIGATSKYEGNITQNGSWDLTNGVDNNQTVSSGLLISGTDFYRLATGSPAINAGIGTYSFLDKDILDGNRSSNYDAGAEEFGANGTRLPYTIDDVGKKVGFAAPEFILNIEENTFTSKGIIMYPIPSKNQHITIQSNDIIGTIEVRDLRGRVVLKKQIDSKLGQIETDNLSSGTYIAKVQGVYGRFVIQ